VDWYPWGPEAFEKAKGEDKPIFLSIGYSTCHWCHVMERESFENEETAQVMSEHVVSVKVDREERPDLDQVYMIAVQLLTGSGGWPMSVFLTPDGRPFFGGTYFTPGRFRAIVGQIASAYHSRRPEIEQAADDVVAAVARHYAPPGEPAALDGALVTTALDQLRGQFDAANGGFGGAPKFPPHGALPLLFHQYCAGGDERLLFMATRTLEAMALGGIHDHIAGGFHRYATDARWFLPHFEKMLYDNALLSRAYVEAHVITGDSFYREVAEGIYGWVAREMSHPDGGFYSAQDAESEGVEGKFYVWTRGEILNALGPEEGELFCRIYGVEEQGNYREEPGGRPSGDPEKATLGMALKGRRTGANILHLNRTLAEWAEEVGLPSADLAARISRARQALLAARERRVRPHLDDKIIASWNGLMIASLAYAGRRLGEPRYTDAARKAAHFVISHLRLNEHLLRRWREGEAKVAGFLEDYAFLAAALLELHETTGERDWLAQARELMEAALSLFWDEPLGPAGGSAFPRLCLPVGEGNAFPEGLGRATPSQRDRGPGPDRVGAQGREGGFFFTAEGEERLFIRPKEVFDHPLPSGNGIAAQVLVRLAAVTGEPRYADLAGRTLRACAPWMAHAPQGTQSLVLALAMHLEGLAA